MMDSSLDLQYILVTGPQRSGTRFGAKVFRSEFGHRYIDETEIHTDSLYSAAELLIPGGADRLVVQCPGLCRNVHFFGDRNDVLIVMMIRDLADIRASQDRIRWGWETLELSRYDAPSVAEIAHIKYTYWQMFQRPGIKHWHELCYESLSAHRLWIPKERRTDFGFAQTEE